MFIWVGIIFIDWIELCFLLFLITAHLKIHVCWKNFLHQPANVKLTFPKNYFLHLAETTYHRQHCGPQTVLERCALRTVRYSWRLSTVDTTLLFTDSMNSTNSTVHILQCVTVMNQDILQHSTPGPTSTALSHTRLHLTDGLFWLKGRPCVDSLRYLYVYRISTICILVSDWEEIGFHIYISLSFKGPHIRNLKRHTVAYLGEALHFKPKCCDFESQCGDSEYSMNYTFRLQYAPRIDIASNANECLGCLLGHKRDCVQGWQVHHLYVPIV
jgi:hypothetical protein